MTIKVLGLSLYGSLAASTRYRMTQFIPGLEEEGTELSVHGLLGDDYVRRSYAGEKYPLPSLLGDYAARLKLLLHQRRYDVALINAELFPLLPGWAEAGLLRIPFIYDFDDAFFLKYRLPRFRRVSFLLRNKFDPIVGRAASVLAGNAYLAEYARLHNPATHILPTVVDDKRYQPKAEKDPAVFTLGWIGSPSTSVYLSELQSPLQALGKEGRVRLVVVGGSSAPIPGVEVVNLPWSEATEVDLINTFDVGVMPLFDDPWARGKCAFKLIQYMACGVPVVASPVGANCDVVTPSCGFLPSDDAGWLQALRTLRDSLLLRARMGEAGRARVVEHFSLRGAVPIMAETIKRVVAGH